MVDKNSNSLLIEKITIYYSEIMIKKLDPFLFIYGLVCGIIKKICLVERRDESREGVNFIRQQDMSPLRCNGFLFDVLF